MKNPTELACYLEGLECGRDQTKVTIDRLEELLQAHRRLQGFRPYSPYGEYSTGIIDGYKRGIVHANFGLMCLVEKIKEAKEEIEASFEELASSDLGGEV